MAVSDDLLQAVNRLLHPEGDISSIMERAAANDPAFRLLHEIQKRRAADENLSSGD